MTVRFAFPASQSFNKSLLLGASLLTLCTLPVWGTTQAAAADNAGLVVAQSTENATRLMASALSLAQQGQCDSALRLATMARKEEAVAGLDNSYSANSVGTILSLCPTTGATLAPATTSAGSYAANAAQMAASGNCAGATGMMNQAGEARQAETDPHAGTASPELAKALISTNTNCTAVNQEINSALRGVPIESSTQGSTFSSETTATPTVPEKYTNQDLTNKLTALALSQARSGNCSAAYKTLSPSETLTPGSTTQVRAQIEACCTITNWFQRRFCLSRI